MSTDRDLATVFKWMGLVAAVGIIAAVGTVSKWHARAAPDFTEVIVSGEGAGDRVRLRSLRGHVVLVDFWASWCPPCVRSIPKLERIAARYANRPVRVVGINVETDRSSEEVGQHHRAMGATFPTLHDPSLRLQRSYGVELLPTLFLIDPAGRIRHIESGEIDETDLTALIDELL